MDAVAKCDKVSLNNKLLVKVLDLLNNLVGVLLRFMPERVAIRADIEAMFYQGAVNEWPALRFLWRNHKCDQHPQVYTNARIVAMYYIFWKTADDDRHDPMFSPETINALKGNFYMDANAEVRTWTLWVSSSLFQSRVIRVGLRSFISEKKKQFSSSNYINISCLWAQNVLKSRKHCRNTTKLLLLYIFKAYTLSSQKLMQNQKHNCKSCNRIFFDLIFASSLNIYIVLKKEFSRG